MKCFSESLPGSLESYLNARGRITFLCFLLACRLLSTASTNSYRETSPPNRSESRFSRPNESAPLHTVSFVRLLVDRQRGHFVPDCRALSRLMHRVDGLRLVVYRSHDLRVSVEKRTSESHLDARCYAHSSLGASRTIQPSAALLILVLERPPILSAWYE